jgi:hypothetical protein
MGYLALMICTSYKMTYAHGVTTGCNIVIYCLPRKRYGGVTAHPIRETARDAAKIDCRIVSTCFFMMFLPALGDPDIYR